MILKTAIQAQKVKFTDGDDNLILSVFQLTSNRDLNNGISNNYTANM